MNAAAAMDAEIRAKKAAEVAKKKAEADALVAEALAKNATAANKTKAVEEAKLNSTVEYAKEVKNHTDQQANDKLQEKLKTPVVNTTLDGAANDPTRKPIEVGKKDPLAQNAKNQLKADKQAKKNTPRLPKVESIATDGKAKKADLKPAKPAEAPASEPALPPPAASTPAASTDVTPPKAPKKEGAADASA